MADVPAALKDWSATASSNSPTDATTIGSGLADNIQALQAVVRGDLASKGSDIASSAAPDVAAVTGLYHDLTGNATVTGLGSGSAGIWKILQTDGTPVFTHNTAMAMPGAANFQADVGDVLGFFCETTNQWRCMFGSPFSVPTGVVSPYAGTTAPGGWLLCYGQAVSRSTYARLFAAISTTYGAGDASTTFNLPDLRGRVVAGQDDMGGTSANRLTDQTGGLDGDTLGDTGGAETHQLTIAQMPAHTHDDDSPRAPGTSFNMSSAGSAGQVRASGSTGGDGAHNNVQPTIILNYIIKT